MMTTPQRHRCGGTLFSRQVDVRSEEDGLTFQHRLPGLVCDACNEELIDRDTAAQIEKSLTPMIWFTTAELGTFQTEPITLKVPSSSLGVAA